MKKNLLTLITSLIFVFHGLSQDKPIEDQRGDSLDIKHFSIGLKLGIPNLAAATAEVVLPLVYNHFAPYAEYSQVSLNFTALETITSYTELGLNYYFKSSGNGFFIGLGRGILNTDISFKNLLFLDRDSNFLGSAQTLFNLNTTNLKLGIKTSGTFYFRFEIGYGIGTLPDQLVFSASANGITNLFKETLPPLPGLGSNGLLIGAIGFGLSL